MGAPKQKWTAEVAALKAGVLKHGVGIRRPILKDPEFSVVLYLWSNVDLKDKWRNLSVMANGWTSREKSRDEINVLTKSQIDLELAKLRSMTPQEAAAVASREFMKRKLP
ncbi:hypothetical protein TanjilG_27073 [Lupinus angustifolius]|uniref:MYB transcription factor n=1 Tax=Lupinus angustifolius TaxID=3871 RepID=A0A4P1QWH4_LUPAN|nr:hypothetical protein TanjilG_27073 [Lupinus angustifolius]